MGLSESKSKWEYARVGMGLPASGSGGPSRNGPEWERATQSAETDRLLFDNLTRLSHAEIDARQLTAVISAIVTRAVRADHAVVCAVAALA